MFQLSSIYTQEILHVKPSIEWSLYDIRIKIHIKQQLYGRRGIYINRNNLSELSSCVLGDIEVNTQKQPSFMLKEIVRP